MAGKKTRVREAAGEVCVGDKQLTREAVNGDSLLHVQFIPRPEKPELSWSTADLRGEEGKWWVGDSLGQLCKCPPVHLQGVEVVWQTDSLSPCKTHVNPNAEVGEGGWRQKDGTPLGYGAVSLSKLTAESRGLASLVKSHQQGKKLKRRHKVGQGGIAKKQLNGPWRTPGLSVRHKEPGANDSPSSPLSDSCPACWLKASLGALTLWTHPLCLLRPWHFYPVDDTKWDSITAFWISCTELYFSKPVDFKGLRRT